MLWEGGKESRAKLLSSARGGIECLVWKRLMIEWYSKEFLGDDMRMDLLSWPIFTSSK